MNQESLKKRALDLKGEVAKWTADMEAGNKTPAEYKAFIDKATEESCEIETTLKAFDQAGRFMANQDTALEQISQKSVDPVEREPGEPAPMTRKEFQSAFASMKASVKGGGWGENRTFGFEFGLKSQGDVGMMGENAFGTTAGTQIADGQYFLPGTAGPDVLPQFIPGILELRWFDNIVASLFPSFPTNSPVVSFVREQSWTNNAAPVSEGATLPYSQNTISRHNAQVGDIGNMIKVSDQMIQDSRYFLGLVEKRAAQGVSRQEEVQILAGEGYPGVEGLLSFSTQFQQTSSAQAAISNLVWPTANTPGLGTSTATIASVTPGRLIGSSNTATGSQIAIGILAMLTDIRVNTLFEPTAVVLNPADWFTLRTWTDANGQFFGGNPWGWDYGQAKSIRDDVQAVMPNEQLWGKRIAVTPAIPEGFILAGDFVNGGQILRLGGLRVEMVQTNVDDFEKRLWSMRAYTRVGLATERPNVFELAVLDNVSPL